MWPCSLFRNGIDRYPREWDKSPYRGNRGYLPHPRPRAAYAGMISQMDHNVGRLLDTLKACGGQKYHRHFYQRQRHHA